MQEQQCGNVRMYLYFCIWRHFLCSTQHSGKSGAFSLKGPLSERAPWVCAADCVCKHFLPLALWQTLCGCSLFASRRGHRNPSYHRTNAFPQCQSPWASNRKTDKEKCRFQRQSMFSQTFFPHQAWLSSPCSHVSKISLTLQPSHKKTEKVRNELKVKQTR